MIRLPNMLPSRTSFSIILSLAILVLASGCRRDPLVEPEQPTATTGTLRLTMIPEWNGEPLQFFHEYRNVSDYRTTVEFLKLYWSGVQLTNGQTGITLTDVELFDLQHGPVTMEWKVKPGEWTGLRAGLGLPSALNHTDPALYASTHPMSVNSGMYWTWASGYKFVLFEGRYDLDPASNAPFVNAYSIHTGLDTCYTMVQLYPVDPIVVDTGAVTQVTVRVAVDRFFHGNAGIVDLSTEYASHGTNIPLALKFTHNVEQSFSIE